MASALKSIARKALRFYLTNTPIKKGRYPLMMLVHGWAKEPVTVEVETKDRGRMVLELDDIMQFPVYYNIFEAKYDHVMKTLLIGSDVVIDVGGNIGQYALLFTKYARKVYTFEPMPKMIARLKRHIDMNGLNGKLVLISKALSNKPDTIQFELPKSANSGTASTVLGRVANSAEIINVEAVRLDDLVASGEIAGRIDLVKIDIEGAELFALEGMAGILQLPEKPILILEMNEEMMGLAGYGAAEIQSYLAQFGFKPYEITKRGLRGPNERIASDSENYCFLTAEHTSKPAIKALIYTH